MVGLRSAQAYVARKIKYSGSMARIRENKMVARTKETV